MNSPFVGNSFFIPTTISPPKSQSHRPLSMSNQSKLVFKDSFRGDDGLETLLKALTLSPDSPVDSPSKTTKPATRGPETKPQPWTLSFDNIDLPVYPPTANEPLHKKSKPRISSGSSQFDDPEIIDYIASTELKGESYGSLKPSQT